MVSSSDRYIYSSQSFFSQWMKDNSNLKSAKYKYLQPWSTKRDEILGQMSHEVSSKMNCFSLLDRGRNIARIDYYSSYSWIQSFLFRPNAATWSTGGLTAKTDRVDFEDGIIFEVNDMTPSDFARRIKNYHDEVMRAWREDQRVKSIKIVIQVGEVNPR